MTDFNLGQALAHYKETSEITVLDRGTYRLECTSAKSGVAKGGPTITPVFKVVGGPQAGSRVMAGKMSFSENALWKTIPQLHGFGITDEFIQQAASTPDSIKTIADAMVGRIVDATLSIDNWQGEDRNKLDRVAVASSGGQAPPPPPGRSEPQQVYAQAPPQAAAPAPTAPAPVPQTAPLPPAPTPSF